MQQINEKDGGDGIFKNGETGCSGQNREREMRCGSESLRNPSSSPGHSSSMTHSLEMLFHFRHPGCPAGSGWWSIGDAKLDRAYFCPWCGQQLESEQRPH